MLAQYENAAFRFSTRECSYDVDEHRLAGRARPLSGRAWLGGSGSSRRAGIDQLPLANPQMAQSSSTPRQKKPPILSVASILAPLTGFGAAWLLHPARPGDDGPGMVAVAFSMYAVFLSVVLGLLLSLGGIVRREGCRAIALIGLALSTAALAAVAYAISR